MTEYRPKSRCPKCSRAPNVSYAERTVRQAKLERQSARVNIVKCHRCGEKYWIRAGEIANASPDPSTNGSAPQYVDGIPEGFPEREAIIEAGFETLDALRAVKSLAQTKGIGPKRAKAIRDALDGVGVA